MPVGEEEGEEKGVVVLPGERAPAGTFVWRVLKAGILGEISIEYSSALPGMSFQGHGVY